MKSFCLFENGIIVDIFCEASTLGGVKRVAGTVSEDYATQWFLCLIYELLCFYKIKDTLDFIL